MRTIAFAAGLASIGCAATLPPLTPPEQGGAPWSELTSAHFRLDTDVDQATAERALRWLEQSHAALAVAMQRPTVKEEPIQVAMFSRPRDFAALAHHATAAAYFKAHLPLDLEARPVIVIQDSDLDAETRLVVQHELAHRFLHERFARLPRWLDEGLAGYYSSARIDGERIILGGPSERDFVDRQRWSMAWVESFEQLQIPRRHAPTVAELVRADAETFYGGDDTPASRLRSQALYAGAWRLVHLFISGPSPVYKAAFLAFLEDLQRGTNARAAFDARFGPIAPQLEVDYRAYLSESPLRLVAVRARRADGEGQPAPAPLATRALTPAEVHVLWARLLPHAAAAAQLDAAAATAPRGVEVRLAKAMWRMNEKDHEDVDLAKAEIDAALAAAPDDPRCLYAALWWHELRGGVEAIIAAPDELVERLVQVATTARQLTGAARHYARRGRPEVGLPLALRAVKLDPIDWTAQDALAQLLLASGRADEARIAAERATALFGEGAMREIVEPRRIVPGPTRRGAP